MNLPPAPTTSCPNWFGFKRCAVYDHWRRVAAGFRSSERSEADSVSVLAAVISPDLVEQIRKTCNDADLIPKRLVLRPFAGASLFRRHDRGPLSLVA